MIEFELPDISEISETGTRLLLEITIKQNGGIWRVHKNDLDDIFPSDLHAHRVDKKEILDIYNGKVYSNGVCIRKLSKKEMLYIYNKIMESNETEIKDKLKANIEEITYLKCI